MCNIQCCLGQYLLKPHPLAFVVHLWKDGGLSDDITAAVDGTSVTVYAPVGYDKAVVAVLKAGQSQLGNDWANVDYQSEDLTITSYAATVVWEE